MSTDERRLKRAGFVLLFLGLPLSYIGAGVDHLANLLPSGRP